MYKQLFYILRSVVNDCSIEQERLRGLSSQDWEEVYRLAKRAAGMMVSDVKL